MINGAITMGTMDGANVEIFEQVGKDNMFLFGMNVDEVNALWARGYDPHEFLATNPALREVIDMLTSGVLGRRFDDIAASLLTTRYGVADRYMAIADFADYARAQKEAGEAYLDRNRFLSMSLCNIAKAGIFSADRSVMEYADNIWKM
jgi:starch phosphorylase